MFGPRCGIPFLVGLLVVYYEREGNIPWSCPSLKRNQKGVETAAGVPYDSPTNPNNQREKGNSRSQEAHGSPGTQELRRGHADQDFRGTGYTVRPKEPSLPDIGELEWPPSQKIREPRDA